MFRFFRLSFLLCLWFISSSGHAQNPAATTQVVYKAMLDFKLKAIRNIVDTNLRNYFSALPYALYNRTDTAQSLLKSLALTKTNPNNQAARNYLLASYMANGQYADYCRFVEQDETKPDFYEDAVLFSSFPSSQLHFLTDAQAVSFTLRRKSYVIITAYLNGQRARLLLDTGATFTCITDKLAQRAGLDKKPSKAVFGTATNTPTTGSSALLNRLTFGNVDVRNLPVKCFPTIVRGLHVDGLLGMDILHQLAYTIDFNSRLCTVKKPVVLPMDSTANLFRETVALLRVTTTDNQPLYFLYDSGSNLFNLTNTASDKIAGHRLKKSKTRSRGINKTHLTERTNKLNQFAFIVGRQTASADRVSFTTRQPILYNIPVDGIMTNKPFHTGTLTIDFPNGKFSYDK